MATTDIYTIVGSIHPTINGTRWLGGAVDDQIQVNAAAAAAIAGAHTKGCMACWVMVPDRTGTYTAVSFGDASVVEYMQVTIEAGTVQFVLVDNTTTLIDVNTPANSIQPHRWHHVAVVQDGTLLKIYIDGILQTLTWTTRTNPGAWASLLSGLDSGSIGAAEMDGAGNLTQEFKGYIGPVAYWGGTVAAAALSEEEVRRAMYAPESVEATYLQNYWKCDGDVNDDGTGADNGTIVGDVIYVSANEFASRMTFGCGTMLVADKVVIGSGDNIAYGLVIQAA